MTFGAFIGTRRKAAKLNLRDTAKYLGIAYGYLCDIEQGRRPAPEGQFVDRMKGSLWIEFPPSWSWTSRSMNCF